MGQVYNPYTVIPSSNVRRKSIENADYADLSIADNRIV